MSDMKKGLKIVNSIGLGIMAALSSGVVIQPASAEGLGETQNVAQNQVNEAVSQNQETVDAFAAAGDAINNAQASVTEAGDIPNSTEIQGALEGAGDAMGKLENGVEKLEQANADAQETVEDYNSAVEDDKYRDGAAENIGDAKDAAQNAQDTVNENKDAVDEIVEENQELGQDL